tara:strand:+ start:219 stop:566 length:348 start_codon:yes stop_codon:yes gene_type:complete
MTEIEKHASALNFAFNEWEVSPQTDTIRMARYYNLNHAQRADAFVARLGDLLQTKSILVLAKRVAESNQVSVVFHFKPDANAALTAAEIAAYCDEVYLESAEEAAVVLESSLTAA